MTATTPSTSIASVSGVYRHASAQNFDAAQTISVDSVATLQRKGSTTPNEAKIAAAQTLGQILAEYPAALALEPGTAAATVARLGRAEIEMSDESARHLSNLEATTSTMGAMTMAVVEREEKKEEEAAEEAVEEGKLVTADNNGSFQQLVEMRDAETDGSNLEEFASSMEPTTYTEADNRTTPTGSIRSIGSLVCRICHNSENPEKLVSPCLCKGSLTYVHIYCLERWISTSRSTSCELCQFQYNTEQTLRYSCLQSLRMWYSRSMSRRALQEDCQMFSLLTLVAFGIIGTLLVGIQYYFLQSRTWGLGKIWTKGWLIFFLLITLAIYFMNVYMIVRSQLTPWYRWWQSARDIKLILENRRPFKCQSIRMQDSQSNDEPTVLVSIQQLQQQHQTQLQQQQQQQTLEQREQQREAIAPAIVPRPRTAILPLAAAVLDQNVV